MAKEKKPLADFDVEAFRLATTKMMTCERCGHELYIGDTGLVCKLDCGGIRQPNITYEKLILAWPDRVIKGGGMPTRVKDIPVAKHRKLAKSHPQLPCMESDVDTPPPGC